MEENETAKVQLGKVCIEISCQDQQLMEELRTDYHSFLASRKPDFRIELNLRHSLTAPEVKQLLTSARSHVYGSRLVTEPELLDCRVNWEEATLWVDTERELFAPSVEYKLMNVLMRGIYSGIHAKLKNTPPDAYLVHGCGIVDGDQCYLFTGPSGAGKTTVARLAGKRTVLNDEAVLIGRNKEGFYLAGTPFDGGQPDKCSTSVPLSSILFLKHERRVSLRRLSKVETYRQVLLQIFDTTPLFEMTGKESLEERAALGADIAVRVPTYELGFRPDTSFWQVVEAI